MLDFTLDSPRHFLFNEIVSRAEAGKTARAPGDRRAAVAGSQSAATIPRKRRRHDGLYVGKHAPLDW